MVCASKSLVAAIVLYAVLAGSSVQATIVTSGSLTGFGTPYAGQDPWLTNSLIVGDTTSGSVTINGGSDLNNGGAQKIGANSPDSIGTVTVDGSGSTWNNSGPAGPGGSGGPGPFHIGEKGSGTLTITNGGSVSSDASLIASAAGSDGIVTVQGAGSTWNNRSVSVGSQRTGALTITDGGSTTSSETSHIGFNGTGIVTVGGGAGSSTWTNFGWLYVGHYGTGTLDITGGGSVSNANAIIGQVYIGSGTVTVGGGTGSASWTNSGTLTVGYSGTGTLHVTGGGSVSSPTAHIGFNYGSNGLATVGGGTGTATWFSSSLYVGTYGTGRLEITGGGSVSNFEANIGTYGPFLGNDGGIGTVTVGGGAGAATWTIYNRLTVGHEGIGTLDITGGGSVSNEDCYIGDLVGGNGTVTVSGGTGAATWTNSSNLRVGNSGTGALHIAGGGSVSNTAAYLGYSAGSSGTVTVGGSTGAATWTNSSDLYIGNSGTGALSITGGGSVSNRFGYLGYSSGSSGTVTVGGGTGGATWTNSRLYVGNSGSGSLSINTGGLVSTGLLDGGNASSSINLNGGTLRIRVTDSASNKINLLAGGGTFDIPTAGTVFTVTSAMSGAGGLTKTGEATLSFSGANSYMGNTTLSGGTLAMFGTGSFANCPMISVGDGATLRVTGVTGGANYNGARFTLASGQTLQGTGTVVGAMGVASGATIAPGFSIGTLNTADISVAAGGTLALEIDLGMSPGADLLNVAGNLAINNSVLNMSLDNPTPGAPKTFLVAANDGSDPITGTFGSITLPAGGVVTLNYTYIGTDFLGRVGDGNDLAITILAPGLPGDYSADGVVDAADYVVWRRYVGTSNMLSNDYVGGTIGQAQFDQWRANYGLPAPGGGSGWQIVALEHVPEPVSVALLVAGMLMLVIQRLLRPRDCR